MWLWCRLAGWDETSSISNIKNNAISIFPNPANDKINITINDKKLISEIEIIDIFGRTINKIKNLKNQSVIDISNLTKGVYFIKTKENSFKFIKK